MTFGFLCFLALPVFLCFSTPPTCTETSHHRLVSLLAFASSVDWRLSSNVLFNNRLQNDQAWVGPLVTAEQFKAWYEVDEVIYADEVAAFAARAGKTIHILHGIEPIPTVPCSPPSLRPWYRTVRAVSMAVGAPPERCESSFTWLTHLCTRALVCRDCM